MATPIADGVVSIVDDNEDVLGTKCVGRILVCRGVDCAGAPWGWKSNTYMYGYMYVYLFTDICVSISISTFLCISVSIHVPIYVYIWLYSPRMCFGSNVWSKLLFEGTWTGQVHYVFLLCEQMHINIYVHICTNICIHSSIYVFNVCIHVHIRMYIYKNI